MERKSFGPLTRSTRCRGPHRQPAVRGFRRMPTTIGGALLGMLGLVLF